MEFGRGTFDGKVYYNERWSAIQQLLRESKKTEESLLTSTQKKSILEKSILLGKRLLRKHLDARNADDEAAAATKKQSGKTPAAPKKQSSSSPSRRTAPSTEPPPPKQASSSSRSSSSSSSSRSSSSAELSPIKQASKNNNSGGGGPKIAKIVEVLDSKFPPPLPVPLNHSNPFQFLVAVVLSAQTTDGKVNECTDVLFQEVRGPKDVLRLGQDAVAEHIKTLGLYQSKAKYLMGLSSKLLENALYASGELVPSTREELTALPGVGNKTASVVLSQIFGEPNLGVDTHVHRLSLRWGLTKETKDPSKVQADLEKLFPRELWTQVHLQVTSGLKDYRVSGKNCPSYFVPNSPPPPPSPFPPALPSTLDR